MYSARFGEKVLDLKNLVFRQKYIKKVIWVIRIFF